MSGQRVSWRDMTGSTRVAYVVGWMMTAALAVGAVVIIVGLLWRAVRWVWGL